MYVSVNARDYVDHYIMLWGCTLELRWNSGRHTL